MRPGKPGTEQILPDKELSAGGAAGAATSGGEEAATASSSEELESLASLE